MIVSVFGLGYVGTVTGACLAELGARVIGVDVNRVKVDLINGGHSPVVEAGLDALIKRTVEAGTFSATVDVARAVADSDAALVCVGTPSRTNGSLDLTFVRRVTREIGAALAAKRGYFVFILRSTVLPGTVEEELIPLLEECSGKKAGVDFGVCMNPEFLREGSSVADFFEPPRTVIGQLDARSGDVVAQLCAPIKATIFRVPIPIAEMLKYTDNAFHALKVTFANEIGSICKSLKIDSHKVMELFVSDTKLNLSPYYLKPGFAFGGSCLPKDLRALAHKARTLDIETPLLSSILPSNRLQISRVASRLMEYKGRTLGFLGLSFKNGTDDLRESPLVELIETMLGRGFAIRIYDRFVSLARILGANKDYIEHQIPHISTLMCDSADELMARSDVVVIGNRDPDFGRLLDTARPGQTIIDLVRVTDGPVTIPRDYDGISW